MWPIKTILHPTDFSACSQGALHLACSLARDHRAHLVVLHVTSVPDLAYTGYGAPGTPMLADEYIARAKDDLAKLPLPNARLPVERRLEEGDPAAEIIRVAAEAGADLIVMGTHGQTGLPHLLMGSVAEQVVRQASCPVLTLRFRPEKEAAGAPPKPTDR
jgi:nucleotide-binding universal stress UspA family protein